MPIFQSVKPRIALTLGDAAGIGPEVAVKALQALPRDFRSKVVMLGRASLYRRLAKRLSSGIEFQTVTHLSQLRKKTAYVPCYFPFGFPESLVPAKPTPCVAKAAMRSIKLAVSMAMAGEIGAMVTPPINKAALIKAGYNICGHTELLAKLSQTNQYEMMLAGGPLRVVLATRHVAYKEVSKLLSKKKLEETILLTAHELKNSFGIQRPRIAVCSLNPHAGEEGYFGDEEIKIISPAVRNAKKKTHAKIIGPLSSDVLFYQAYTGVFDAEICMYHDQGLIPLKMISRGTGVNITLGLPFVRTSPDHGTAYDIAGSFKADPGSMRKAIELADQLMQHRQKHV